jgi:hypothetical protein
MAARRCAHVARISAVLAHNQARVPRAGRLGGSGDQRSGIEASFAPATRFGPGPTPSAGSSTKGRLRADARATLRRLPTPLALTPARQKSGLVLLRYSEQ